MQISEYRAIYANFVDSLFKAFAVNRVSDAVFRDVPASFPKELRERYNRGIEEAITVEARDEHRSVNIDIRDEIVGPLIMVVLWHTNSEKNRKLEFGRLILSQQLIMTIAFLEAFISDTMRAICMVQPNVMKSEKTWEWGKILAAGSWDQLINELIDQFVFDFSRPSISERIAILRKRIGIKLNISQDRMLVLDEAENLRHAFIHNGGKADQRYLDKARGISLAIGEPIPIDLDYVTRLRDASLLVSEEIFNRVSEKFFGIDAK